MTAARMTRLAASRPTHALLSGSPGIDQGNNVKSSSADQRALPFARVSGASADMGSYEVQQTDAVFDTAFVGCGI